jgi:hypothetical protein
LRLAVLEHGEIVARQPRERPSVLVKDQRVDLDQASIDAKRALVLSTGCNRDKREEGDGEFAELGFQSSDSTVTLTWGQFKICIVQCAFCHLHFTIP